MPEIIYTDTIGYPQKRNIVDLPHRKYKVEKRLNAFRIPNALYFKYYNASNSFFLNSHYEPLKTKNIHHFFNTISFGNAPWITTFETLLPRWGKVPAWLEKKGVELMAGQNCKKLIAISQCTKDIQAEYLTKFPEFKEGILGKTIVLHPPQPVLLKQLNEKIYAKDGIVRLLLVGNQICSKGGREVVNAVIRLYSEGAPIRLTIVSGMEPDSYASHTSTEDILKLKQLITNNQQSINFLGRQPNDVVKRELYKADVALLPTYADTYGYFVLEAQAAGCSVITTDIRALPEINNNLCGWVILVPKDKYGNGILNTKEEREQFSSIIEEKLYKLLSEICSNPDVIRIRGAAALERINKNHNPVDVAQVLHEIYKTS